jgi:hypothetical protein
VLGVLFIFLVAALGVGIFCGFILLCWATVNVDWKWAFSVPPGLGLLAIGETRVAKGIVALYKEFF